MTRREVYLPDIIGKGYGDFWRFKGRYRVCKGSRASKKSKTTALNFIKRIMEYEGSNLLVVRKVKDTLRDSCFSDLKWAISRLQVDGYWTAKTSPMEMIYEPTGQKILFRGLDDPLKLTSITVDKGSLCWVWIEEAYEISDENAFNMLDESIRGNVEAPLFKQITLTFNPWNERHFIKRRFFDVQDPDIMAKTTNYTCNEFLDESDKLLFERMKRDNPRRYKVAGLGEWGIVDGLVYENWTEREFNVKDIITDNTIPVAGLDFGYVNDETAFVAAIVDQEEMKIYVYDELYKKRLSNRDIYNNLSGYYKERIIADCAEPKSIDELRRLGLIRIKGSKKGKDSIMNGVQYLQNYEIIVHPKCVNFLTEICNYTWAKDKFGNNINKPADEFNHLMDALRYATEPIRHSNKATIMDKSLLGI